ncbi:UrcA family protein [Sphingomonas jejuensis]|uniref:UrcA family protein n=1 Tax=Sphingomonas jejuensis TaxID=904715 RepID=A0ABX0XMN3_9SPHN|nr:UrcA family protein [Sphingomonas jejuensis]NJC34634.1 UrcA family protein [Sphingomonas jejuensis]
MTKFITTAAMCAAALLATAAPAAARPIVNSASEEVFYGDLDLSQPEHAAEMDQRLRTAARNVCRRLGPNRDDLGGVRCRNTALSNARAAINGRR